MRYKASLFNYYFDLDNGATGIFNTLSGLLAGFEADKCRMIKNFGEGNYDLEQDTINALISNGFIVPYVLNEYDFINSRRIKSILNNDVSIYRARCFYCYEGSAGHEYMNLDTAEQTVKFIADHIENRKCLIQCFCGEPLMNIPVIDFISDKLGSILGNDRVRFVMMTNASLVAPEVVCKMKQRWNLSIVQVTLDGTRDEYERRKNYLSIKRSFDVVIGNIKSILQTGIKVSIRLNYDKKNCSALCELIQYLREQNFHRKNNLSVYSYPIFCTGGNQRDNSPGWEEWNAIRKSLVENGFVLPLEAYSLNKRKNQCYGCSAKSFAILPDGSLFKCTAAMKYPYAQVGSIWKGITRYDVIDKWCSVALDSSCSQCRNLYDRSKIHDFLNLISERNEKCKNLKGR